MGRTPSFPHGRIESNLASSVRFSPTALCPKALRSPKRRSQGRSKLISTDPGTVGAQPFEVLGASSASVVKVQGFGCGRLVCRGRERSWYMSSGLEWRSRRFVCGIHTHGTFIGSEATPPPSPKTPREMETRQADRMKILKLRLRDQTGA